MHRSKHKHSLRSRGLAIAVVLIAAAGAMIGSCVFETRTNFCEQFGVRCKEGQECAAQQAVCIDIGGCGDGITDKAKGEICDDGNIVDGEPDPNDPKKLILDQCSHDCLSTQECGNGKMDPGEQCDDGSGNGSPTGTCDFMCRKVSRVCGNGIVDPDTPEECDPGLMDSAGCNGSAAGLELGCKASRCGDGYPNAAAGEKCDTLGIDQPNCNGRICTLPACGDNYINAVAGEQCDGDGKDSQTCNGSGAGPFACHSPACGDGFINTKFTPLGGLDPEQCDTMGGVDSKTCNGNNGGRNGPGSCRNSACGDGYTNAQDGEQCDPLGGDDSTKCNGNGPTATTAGVACQNATCGDGYTNAIAGEKCDVKGGSDAFNCNGSGSAAVAAGVACQRPRCGDGYPNTKANETCDNGDDDSLTCNGSTATPSSVRCQPVVCGDQYVNPKAEDCEPQNPNATDTFICNGNSGIARCKTPACGDGHINTAFTPPGASAKEECDNLGGGDSMTCNGNNNGANGPGACRHPACHDGYFNPKAEECEADGDCGTGKTCNPSCKCV